MRKGFKKVLKKKKIKKYQEGDIATGGLSFLKDALVSGAGTFGVGPALQTGLGAYSTISGIVEKAKAKRAMRDFDKSKMLTKGSTTLKQMLDQPISQKLIESQQDLSNVKSATALQSLSRMGGKGVLGGLSTILRSGQSRDLNIMAQQDAALKRAQSAKVSEEQSQAAERANLAKQEYAAMQEAAKAGKETIYQGLEGLSEGLTYGAGEDQPGAAKQDKYNITFNKKGGVIKGNKGFTLKGKKGVIFPGKKGMVTPEGEAKLTKGPFSHKKNPIDIVKKGEEKNMDVVQKGEKVGEMTGGETVINKEDTKTILEFLMSGDKDNLAAHMMKLYKRFLKK